MSPIEELIEELSDTPIIAAKQICDSFRDNANSGFNQWIEDPIDIILEYYALFVSYTEEHDVDVVIPENIQAMNMKNIIFSMFNSAQDKLHLDIINHKKNIFLTKYKNKFSNSFCYEFSDDEINKIQSLINNLRDNINKFSGFEDKHRQRLLKRLERLQSEIHKKISDLDVFWGLIGDAGVATGKFGKDTKPIVDNIKEIMKITWKAQSKAENIPDNTPMPLLSDKAVNDS